MPLRSFIRFLISRLNIECSFELFEILEIFVIVDNRAIAQDANQPVSFLLARSLDRFQDLACNAAEFGK